jgi:hypothetical protein
MEPSEQPRTFTYQQSSFEDYVNVVGKVKGEEEVSTCYIIITTCD